MMFSEDYVANHISQFELLTRSSNEVYRFTHNQQSYILKKSWMSPDNLSPFWYGLHRVFGFDFDIQRKHLSSVLQRLRNPHINVAELICTSDASRWQIFREADGVKYEPDEFPDSAEIERQLGLYIGYLHSIEYDCYGVYPDPNRKGCFRQDMSGCMQHIMETHWKNDECVWDCFNTILHCDIAPQSYSLIMPDISANQFVYSHDLGRINAVVDVDAYVVGPREWELCILEMCLNNRRPFADGYEQYQNLPDLSQCRSFYRFFSYLCNPWEKVDLQKFMTDHCIL